MTTIATDGKTIAADGLATLGDYITDRNYQKITIGTFKGKRAIFGFAGAAGLRGPAIAWLDKYEAGDDLSKAPKLDECSWTLLIVTEDGIFRAASNFPVLERFEPPVATGAGADYAIGAMLHGASPEEAVKLVASRTIHTGGDILVADIAEVLAVAQPAPSLPVEPPVPPGAVAVTLMREAAE